MSSIQERRLQQRWEAYVPQDFLVLSAVADLVDHRWAGLSMAAMRSIAVFRVKTTPAPVMVQWLTTSSLTGAGAQG